MPQEAVHLFRVKERLKFANNTQEMLMNAPKKSYAAPQLTIHGDVEVLTQQGGFSNTDVPAGTPVGPDGITSVAS